MLRNLVISLGLIVLSVFTLAWIHGNGIPACNITKNIVTDFGAAGTGLVDDTHAFVGAGSFQDFAVNTYLPSNPGNTICLTLPAGTYFFGTLNNTPIFDGITSLVVNGTGATLSNAINLTTTAGTTAGNSVLTFGGGVPSGIVTGLPVIDLTNPTAITGLTVLSKGATSITLSGNVTAPGVSSGDTISIAGQGYFIGTKAQVADAFHSAALQTVSAGSTTATLVTPAQSSIFSANTYAILTGVDLQGYGLPQNPYFWEYVFITNINGSTGVITFQSPLKFSYESTWPQYNAGCNVGGGAGCPAINNGGPATLNALPTSWNVVQFYNGLSIYQWAGASMLNQSGRSITWNNCKFFNFGPNISQNQTVTLNNCDLSSIARLELDKLWDTATFNGGTVEGFLIQSGSTTGNLILNGVHVGTGGISGAPASLSINNSTLITQLQMGAVSYGQTAAVNCTDSTIPGGVSIGGFSDSNMSNVGVTMSGGVITVPRSLESPVTWVAPGVEMYWTGNSIFEIPFSVTDITADATNTYVQTSMSGGFPGLPGSHNVHTSAARKINFSGCSGAPNIVDISQAGARNVRPYTYSNRIYTCTNNVATAQAANPGVPVIDLNSVPADLFIARSITSMSINVSRADTGGGPTVNFHAMAQFDNYPTYATSGTMTNWGAVINLKTAGTRTYTGSTSTWSGSQTGDTLPTIASPSYMGGPMQPFTGTDFTAESGATCPIVTVTIQTQ